MGDYWYVAGPAFNMGRFDGTAYGLPYTDKYVKLLHVFVAWMLYDEGAPMKDTIGTQVSNKERCTPKTRYFPASEK